MTVSVLLQDVRKIDSEALIAGFFEDVRPLKNLAGELDWLLCGALSRLILQNHVQGRNGDVALLTSQGKLPVQKIFLVGLGSRETASPASLADAARRAVSAAIRAGAANIAMEFFSAPGIAVESALQALREGIAAGSGESHAVTILAPDAATYEKLKINPYQQES